MIPGDAVSIVTASGETRKFAMSEVTYAGPADKAPSSKPAEEKTESAPPPK